MSRRRERISAEHANWFVEIALGIDEEPSQLWSDRVDTRFHPHIYPVEWAFRFCHLGRVSWIRIADRAYVHGRDDYDLVGVTPPLREIAAVTRSLERQHRLAFHRDRLVRSNLSGIDTNVRDWVAAL